MPALCKLVEAELDRLPLLEQELSETARQHIQKCECCLSLYTWLSQTAPGADVSAELRGRIAKSLTHSLGPVAPMPAARIRAAQYFCAFLAVAAAAVAVLGAPGFLKLSLWQAASLVTVLGAGAALLSISLGWQTAPGSLPRFSAWAAIGLLAGGFLACACLLFRWESPQAFFTQGWHCSATGVGVALVAAVLLWKLTRRGAALNLTALGGTIGAISGLAGITVLEFACPRHGALHQAVWHGGVLAICIVLGVAAARLLQRRA
ncbi:MAG TPA: NrsF family protein [Bryobacteraceae bacterium]|nr:NrsF family protein [Bryobacteraceae bacterium]